MAVKDKVQKLTGLDSSDYVINSAGT
jgi:hypothetical protein